MNVPHANLPNVEMNSMKFGPAGSELDFVNKYAMLNNPIYEVLQHTWYLLDLSCKGSLADHVIQIGIVKGYEGHVIQIGIAKGYKEYTCTYKNIVTHVTKCENFRYLKGSKSQISNLKSPFPHLK